MGVVFGDIGTSPLYAVKECFSPESPHAVAATPEHILGIISLVVWSLLLLVCLKYVIYVLRADNKGEGGILSLLSLATQGTVESRKKYLTVLLGIFGAALLFGDGMITPAISVLSAVEGLKEASVFGARPTEALALAAWNHRVENISVLITVLIIIGLFSFQFMGSSRVGKLFGPITSLWFVVLSVLGLINIFHAPGILEAFNPWLGLNFLLHGGWHHFVILGSVVLCVTGCESMYADMGHFGAKPIRIGWFTIVFPALILNYLGQGALLLQNPEAAISPFFRLAPGWSLVPLVILATAATVIASQALITGTYSLTLSAIQLGYLPRTPIKHTSEHTRGQIYIPLANWLLMLICIGLVVSFRSSTNLAAAYGIAVTMTMMVTSVMLTFVASRRWGWGKPVSFALCGLFFLLEACFLVANGPKFPAGGWFPIVIAVIMFTVMTTWKKGRELVSSNLSQSGLDHELFIESIHRRPPHRVPGTAIFMSSTLKRTPVALLHNLKHNRVLHERVIFMTLTVDDVPYVLPSKRVEVEELGGGFYRITGHYGFMQQPNVPRLLRRAKREGLDISAEESTFFLGREIIVPSEKPGMARWREHLFGFTSKIAQQPATYFQIPIGRVIELGQQVEI
jgi:KUP system potassium uptake protein